MSAMSRARHLTALAILAIAVATAAAVNVAAAANGYSTLPVPGDAQVRLRSLQPDPGFVVPADPRWRLWPRNANGLTYGTPTETVGGYHEPDLIRVAATNGKVGYAYRIDLEGPTPESPEQALAWQAEQAGKSRTIPVYEVDGATRIGEFVAR